MSIAVAVLRYRLYDVDQVVATTVVYVTLTVLLGGAFVAVILVGGVLLGGGSPFTTAAATLAVALAFRPVRAAVQGRVERSFNPRRWSGEQRVDTFLSDLRAGRREPEAVGETLAEAVGDETSRVYYWLPGQAAHADLHGLPRPRAARRAARTDAGTPRGPAARHRRARRPGRRTPGARAPARPGRARRRDRPAPGRGALAARGGRAVACPDRQRGVGRAPPARARPPRRGAAAAGRHRPGPAAPAGRAGRRLAVRDQLDESVRRLGDAIRGLRELAHGVRPSTLDAGLAPALAELAGRTPVRTVLDVTDERFGAEVEAAAYFVVSEALANALKHATPASIEVLADRVDGRLVVTVVDDGPGGAVAVPGRGLAGMADRVAAMGGTLQVVDGPRRRHPGPGGAAVRVVVVEDQALLREGLARLFRDAGHEVVGLAGDADRPGLRSTARRPTWWSPTSGCRPPTPRRGSSWRAGSASGTPRSACWCCRSTSTAGSSTWCPADGFGYLLKDRVLDVAEFLAAAQRVADGGSALDPDVVATLVRPDDDELRSLSAREREVLGLMAEGLTNAGIAQRLYLTERTVESHTRSVFMKLRLQTDGDGHRRVLAVLSYLRTSR